MDKVREARQLNRRLSAKLRFVTGTTCTSIVDARRDRVAVNV